MKPEEATSPKKRIRDLRVIYEDPDNMFAIASMLWDGTQRIGIRWNGGEGKGYLTTHGHPTWFIMPRDVALKYAQSTGRAEFVHEVMVSSADPLE